MYQVRSCDFCGEDAVGVFESMPPELDPSEAEQRRFALCEDCRDRLQAVVEPYVERLQDGTTDGGSATRTQPVTDAATSGEPAEETRQPSSRSASSRSSSSPSRPDSDSRDGDEDSPTHSRQSPRRSQSASEPSSQKDQSSRSSGGAPSTVDGPKKQSSPREDDVTVAEYVAEREEADEAEETEDESAERPDQRESTPRSPQSSSSGGHPKGYRKVVRLLSNRDGAMSRGDLRALAMNAYALDKDEFETAVDAALRTGDLAEASDGLRAP